MFISVGACLETAGKYLTTRTFNCFRHLISLYIEASKDLVEAGAAVLPLWVACDGADSEHLAYLATHVTYNIGQSTFTTNTYTVTAQGKASSFIAPIYRVAILRWQFA